MVQPHTQNDIPEPSLPEKKPSQMKLKRIVSNPMNIAISVIGFIVLGAIIAPSFLNKATRARQSGAKQTLVFLTRSQFNYISENGKFSDNISNLAGATSSKDYTYYINSSDDTSFVQIAAMARDPELKSLTIVIRAGYAKGFSNKKGFYTLCQSSVATPVVPSVNISDLQRIPVTDPICPRGFEPVGDIDSTYRGS
jgi:Tfp pilus assembly protein PilE